MPRKLVFFSIIIIVLVVSSLFVIPYTRMNSPNSTVEVTLPFSRGDAFTLLKTMQIIYSNETVTVDQSQEILIIEEPGFPLTTVKTLYGNVFKIPTIYFAVPKELSGFYTPVLFNLFNESACIMLTLRHRGRLSGGTPGTCKSALVDVEYDERGLVKTVVTYATVGGAVYAERIDVVARSVNGESRVKVLDTCIEFYSSNIMYSLPGLYEVKNGKVHYVNTRNYTDFKPLLLVLKTPENNQIWETLPRSYQGYVLLVSPLLVDLERVPELDLLLKEKVVRLP